jgi:hypothetical protein
LVSENGFPTDELSAAFAIHDLLRQRGELGKSMIGLSGKIDFTLYASLFDSDDFASMDGDDMFNWTPLDSNRLKFLDTIAQVMA